MSPNNGQPPPLEVDFGDELTLPPATLPAVNGSKPHPADEEWEPPRRETERPRQVAVRTLPFSQEAEEHLLSCCLLDGADVISKAIEARIRPDSFYDSKNGIIYEILVRLYNAKKLTDLSVVVEELKTAKLLDAVGGYAFLMQVSGRMPTTAQAGYFIDKVREQSLLRETIRAGTAMVDGAYNFSGGIEEFLDDQQERLKKVVEGNSVSRAEMIAARSFNIDLQIKKPDPIYTLAETTVSTPGNLTAIYSQAKTGKSSLIGAMMAAAMTTPTSGHDTLGIVGPNYHKGALLHFDTEQSPYDWQQLVKSSLRRVGLEKPPAWLMSYTLTGMSAEDCRAFIYASLKRAKKLHGSIHSVIIDGIADLVVDPNDPAECFPLITALHAGAIEYNTAIVAILHMNPGSDIKGRGHLGSQLERKAESNLTLEKNENDVTRVHATKQRGKTIPRDKEPSFQWSEEHQMHRSCATPSGGDAKSSRDNGEKYTFSEFKNSFPTAREIPKSLSEIHRSASASVPIKLDAFYPVVRGFVRDGFIVEHDHPGQKKTYQLAL